MTLSQKRHISGIDRRYALEHRCYCCLKQSYDNPSFYSRVLDSRGLSLVGRCVRLSRSRSAHIYVRKDDPLSTFISCECIPGGPTCGSLTRPLVSLPATSPQQHLLRSAQNIHQWNGEGDYTDSDEDEGGEYTPETDDDTDLRLGAPPPLPPRLKRARACSYSPVSSNTRPRTWDDAPPRQ